MLVLVGYGLPERLASIASMVAGNGAFEFLESGKPPRGLRGSIDA